MNRLLVCALGVLCGVFWREGRAETVLLADQGGGDVQQYAVTNGVWTFEKTFASGIYDGASLVPFGIACDGRKVYVGDKNATKPRILVFEKDGTYDGSLTNFDSTVYFTNYDQGMLHSLKGLYTRLGC